MKKLATVLIALLLVCGVAFASSEITQREDSSVRIIRTNVVDEGVFVKISYDIEFKRVLVDVDMMIVYFIGKRMVGGVALNNFPIDVVAGQKMENIEVKIPKYVYKAYTDWELLLMYRQDNFL